ncbi:MAG: DUF975 domain-containing protein [Stigonema ocellatum SAG 48.90 = DSM 106950]|nr:DUF975 domain-containing protein [Stigonema ocellatum SAG 48.90 = DSM 106950]
MSFNLDSPSPMQPLSVGNVVSAGLRLYRSHLKDYFLLALKAYVWLLVPVYGWAKFYALTALISRLAFGELINQPEDIPSGQRYVNSRLWQFLLAMLLMLPVGIGIFVGFLLLSAFVGILLAAFVGGTGQQGNLAIIAVVGLRTIVVGIVALAALLWLLTRFYLVDVPLAIEDNVDGVSTIGRSWELTRGSVWRVLLISFIAFLITLPIQIVVQIITSIVQAIFAPLLQQSSGIYNLLFSITLLLILIFTSGAVIAPFWYSIKAVVYYDLRSRREGLGLRLRDRDM